MADPQLPAEKPFSSPEKYAEAKRLAADESVDEAVRVRLLNKIAAHERATGVGNKGGPVQLTAQDQGALDSFIRKPEGASHEATGGADVQPGTGDPVLDRLNTRARKELKVSLDAENPGFDERAKYAKPSYFVPTSGSKGTLLYVEHPNADNDAEYAKLYDRAVKENKTLYRVRDMEEVGGDNPMSKASAMLAQVREPMMAAVGGADRSLTGGALTSLTLGALEKGLPSVVNKGTLQEFRQAETDNPITAGLGGLAGLAASPQGLARSLGSGVASKEVAKSALGRIGQGATSGLLAGTAQGAVEEGVDAATNAAMGNEQKKPADVAERLLRTGALGGILGGVAQGASEIGRYGRDALRSADSRIGNQLVRAERAGAKTDMVRGIKPSPEMKADIDAASKDGVSAEQHVIDKTVDPVMNEADADMKRVLGEAKAGKQRIIEANEGVKPSMAGIQKRAYEMIAENRAEMPDGKMGRTIPGVDLSVPQQVLNETSNVSVYKTDAPELDELGEDALTLSVKDAQRAGVKFNAPKKAGDYVVVLKPREDLDAERFMRMIQEWQRKSDVSSNIAASQTDSATARAYKPLVREAMDVRNEQLSTAADEHDAMSSALQGMRNRLAGAGIDQNVDKIDPVDALQRQAVADRLGSYASGGKSVLNDQLNALVAENEALKAQLQRLAGHDAYKNVKLSQTSSMVGEKAGLPFPIPRLASVQLRIDPLARLAAGLPPSAPGTMGASAARVPKQGD